MAESPRCIGDKKTKHILASLGAAPGAISPKFFMSMRNVTRYLYSRFHPDLFRFGGDNTEKPLHDRPE